MWIIQTHLDLLQRWYARNNSVFRLRFSLHWIDVNPCFIHICKNPTRLPLYNAKYSFEFGTRLRWWSIVSDRGIHIADSFPIPIRNWNCSAIWYPFAILDLSHFQISIGQNNIVHFFSCFGCSTAIGHPDYSAPLVLIKFT